MSSGPSHDKSEPNEAAGEPSNTSTGAADEASEPTEAAEKTERVDEDGLPLDRDATIDDVRLRTGQHGRYAMGCTLVIVLLIVAFWIVRGAIG